MHSLLIKREYINEINYKEVVDVTGLIAGILIGAFVGVVVTSLCSASSREDDLMELLFSDKKEQED